jgi:hypothetical protein
MGADPGLTGRVCQAQRPVCLNASSLCPRPKDPSMRRVLLVFVPLALLALPASASAAETGLASGKDHTIEIMLGLIIGLLIAMVVIGILEQRRTGRNREH